jgi:hypothetical protein
MMMKNIVIIRNYRKIIGFGLVMASKEKGNGRIRNKI